MSIRDEVKGRTGSQYAQALAGEGAYWDNFVAQRLLRGEMPGSIDWRLAFTQFRYNNSWLPFCLGPQGINFRMREINYILTAAVPQPGARVLDLGCGAGWLSLELARRGAHVTALDISPANLALGRYMADTNTRNFPYLYQRLAGLSCKLEDFGSVEYAYADLNTVNLPAQEYDAIVVWDSLHHVSNIERLFEEVRRAMKPNGVFIGVDHAYATPRTHDFNQTVVPWLEDFYSWITANDPEWFYDGVISLAEHSDWGVLSIDYDPTPVEGFEAFSHQLFKELLDIIRDNSTEEKQADSAEEESPFEDVSAERLISVLLDSFHTERFSTICPFIQPETTIPHYRHEQERIFQHYLACTLINMGEKAIKEGRADGQWFLFQMTTQSPAQKQHLEADISQRLHKPSADTSITAYIAHLESEVDRKNGAIADLEARLRAAEAELAQAHMPRLPWKRGKTNR